MDKYFELKKNINELAANWQKTLGLGHLAITHTFIPAMSESDPTIIAETKAMWEYQTADIKWFLPKAITQTYEDLDETMAHELIHVLLDPMERHVSEKYTEQCEFAVQSLTKAMLRLRYER